MLSIVEIADIVVLVLLMAMSCMMSLGEACIVSLTVGKAHHLDMEGNKRAKLLLHLLKMREQCLRAMLAGNTTANVLAGSVMSALAMPIYGGEIALYINIALTMFILVFCEILPKGWAVRNPGQASLFIAPFLRASTWFFSPLIRFLDVVVNLLHKLFGVDNKKMEVSNIAEDVRGLAAMYSSYDSSLKDDLKMLVATIGLQDAEVSQVMTHRSAVFTINISDSTEKILSEIASSPFSRIPVWKDDQDNVVGILYIKNLSQHSLLNHNISKDEIISSCFEPWYIPDTISLRDQLIAFRRRKVHFAVVVNEYGVFQGIITLEDIIEEIVGAIYDEHDVERNMIVKTKDDDYVVDGACAVRDFNKEAGFEFSSDDAVSIGGLVLFAAERLPAVGEIFHIDGASVQVLSIRDNKVAMVRIVIKSHTEDQCI